MQVSVSLHPLALPENADCTKENVPLVPLLEWNVAFTDSAALMVTEQVVAAPKQPPPDQPEKVSLPAVVSVRVTTAPEL